MSQSFSTADVAKHNKPDDLYIVVDEDVYDLTKFADEHPGGKKILQRVAGKDASKQFWKYHNESILKKYQPPAGTRLTTLHTSTRHTPTCEPRSDNGWKTRLCRT